MWRNSKTASFREPFSGFSFQMGLQSMNGITPQPQHELFDSVHLRYVVRALARSKGLQIDLGFKSFVVTHGEFVNRMDT